MMKGLWSMLSGRGEREYREEHRKNALQESLAPEDHAVSAKDVDRASLPSVPLHAPKIERAYLLRRRCDGYPLVVPESVYYRAMENAFLDYSFDGPNCGEGPTASGHVESDGNGEELYVPAGCITNRGEQYVDDKLNGGGV